MNKVLMIAAFMAVVVAPVMAESKKMVKDTVSKTEVLEGVNAASGNVEGPGSAKHTERSAEGFSLTNGQVTGPRGGTPDAPKVMPRETR